MCRRFLNIHSLCEVELANGDDMKCFRMLMRPFGG